MITQEQLTVTTLGPCTVKSPLRLTDRPGGAGGCFERDSEKLRLPVIVDLEGPNRPELYFEQAGPREWLCLDPAKSRAAIVTCGGLCPGLNNVIRSLVLQLHHHYGVPEVLGIRYGYSGLLPDTPAPPISLTPDVVSGIHYRGGTILGTSRGPVPVEVALESLAQRKVNMLFCIGGDGTQKGAHRIAEEALRRKLQLAVVGIPKTIDNDIAWVWRSFGYFTALDRAADVITCAHVESKSSPNGISLVKLMGREAGFIAAGASLASQDVNFTLIPESPFALEGENGFLAVLHRRMLARKHAVIVVAEGAGQHLFKEKRQERDASGNLRLHDIGPLLRERILDYFAAQNFPVNLRYFDPSYYIRSVPACTDDALLCDQMARNAVHAAMAGKTDVLIGFWYDMFLHVPLPIVVDQHRRVSPDSDLWRSVLAATGQPAVFA
jgi:6-phosphofructokinase 1